MIVCKKMDISLQIFPKSQPVHLLVLAQESLARSLRTILGTPPLPCSVASPSPPTPGCERLACGAREVKIPQLSDFMCFRVI